MTTRRLLAFAAALLTSLGPAGCRRQPPAPATAEQQLLVRLLVSSQVPDRWAREADRGVARIAGELGATIGRTRVEDGSVAHAVGAAGYERPPDLVFCLGSDFANSLFADALLFPDTSFVLVPGRGHPPNVAGVELLPAGAGYVAGVLAAHLRPAPVVGVIRGSGDAWLDDLESGFVAGFQSVRHDARAATAGSAAGVAQLVAEGAEIALYSTDVPDPEVPVAARDTGLLLVTADGTLIEDDPDVVAAAVEVDLAEVMVRLVREVQAGTFSAGNYVFDLGSGVLDVRLGPDLPGDRAADLREALEVARSEVTAGIVEMEGLGM